MNVGKKIKKSLWYWDSQEKYYGDDYKVSNEYELNLFLEYCQKVIERYSFIEEFELWNEPNANWKEEEDIVWYYRMIEGVKKILEETNSNAKLVVGATMTPDKDSATKLSSETFFLKLSDLGMYEKSNMFSIHVYDFIKTGKQNTRYNRIVCNHNQLKNEQGGFFDISISEFGMPVEEEKYTEEEQAARIIQQSVLSKKNAIHMDIMYTLKDKSDNYGILNYDYTPKLSYYALKNYYQNTNGSEYIGTIDLSNGLEAYVYDKDGKPKIITWATSNARNIDIPYQNFLAKDLYGNEIEDTNGTLTITSSPVYLDNVSYSYFNQAISNTATEKYTEFQTKFAQEIAMVPGFAERIENMKNYMVQVGTISDTILESSSIEAMELHYDLGNYLLQAYKDGTLNVEYVKLSSMLDILNDIGNSYEDLVTVTAKTRNPDFETTTESIEEAEKTMKDNQDLEMVYPSKILEFSKEYNEKATYIDSLEEENAIKTGLIMSKNLHSVLLANWASAFANLYIDSYIANNPVSITYSNREWTNQDVKATIVTNANIEMKEGEREYTFSENGRHTFVYSIRGREFAMDATVNNIDKTPPVIEGIIEGKVYTEKIAPKVLDVNLERVELYFNDQLVEGYRLNDWIEEEGMYQLKAIDKAGNITVVSFQVLNMTEEGYQIEKGYIKNIQPRTTVENFQKQLGFQVNYEIQREGQALENTELVATGDTLITQTGETYLFIVAGDIHKDGIVNIKDVVKMRTYLLERNNLDEVELMAADANVDKKPLSIKDLVRMRIMVLNRE